MCLFKQARETKPTKSRKPLRCSTTNDITHTKKTSPKHKKFRTHNFFPPLLKPHPQKDIYRTSCLLFSRVNARCRWVLAAASVRSCRLQWLEQPPGFEQFGKVMKLMGFVYQNPQLRTLKRWVGRVLSGTFVGERVNGTFDCNKNTVKAPGESRQLFFCEGHVV